MPRSANPGYQNSLLSDSKHLEISTLVTDSMSPPGLLLEESIPSSPSRIPLEVDNTKLQQPTAHWVSVIFLGIWAIAVTTVLLKSLGSLKLPPYEKTVVHSKCPPVRCRSCHFYKDNLYLKCAVHPSVVMTQQAADCSDYAPRMKISKWL